MSLELSRRQYAEMYGPTTGDQVRLADTELFIEVEKDLIAGKRGDMEMKSNLEGAKSFATGWDNPRLLSIMNAWI